MTYVIRLALLLIIFFCLHLQANAATLESVKESLVSYSSTEDLEKRVALSVDIIKQVRQLGGQSQLSQFSNEEQAVIQNANKLLIWVVGETRKYELSLHPSLKTKVASGIDESLISAGMTAVPVVRRRCSAHQLNSLRGFVSSPEDFQQIINGLHALVELDRNTNRSHYYQKLLQISETAPPIAYSNAIRAYLKNYILSIYERGETLGRLEAHRKVAKKRSNVLASLKQLGVIYPQQLLSQIFQSAPNCF